MRAKKKLSQIISAIVCERNKNVLHDKNQYNNTNVTGSSGKTVLCQ